MLIIPCPWCGDRDQTEFRYGGQSQLDRPADPRLATDDEWAAFLYYRINPKGLHQEIWVHTWGCRQWFHLVRHTVTHEIAGAYPMGAGPRAPQDGAQEL